MTSQLDEILSTIENARTAKRSNKVKNLLFGGSQRKAVRKCQQDLELAIKDFNVRFHSTPYCSQLKQTQVTSNLFGAVGAPEPSKAARELLANSLLAVLPLAKSTKERSPRSDEVSSCFPGTRTGILKEIMDWATDLDPNTPRCYYLSGAAGTGKTAIARTITERLRSRGLSPAEFFFDHKDPGLRDPTKVIPTIVHQLAQLEQDFKERLLSALEHYPDAPVADAQRQFGELLLQPLQALQRDPRRIIVIVIDAFDECEARGTTEILQSITSSAPSFPSFLKIFITSRPETYIQTVLTSSQNLIVTALTDADFPTRGDILLYLRSQLQRLPVDLGQDLPQDWVDPIDIETLVDKSRNVFGRAVACCRFLSEAPGDLRDQLTLLLAKIQLDPMQGPVNLVPKVASRGQTLNGRDRSHCSAEVRHRFIAPDEANYALIGTARGDQRIHY